MTAPNPSSRDLDLALEALLGLRGRVVQIPDDVEAIAALLVRVRAEARAEGINEERVRDGCASAPTEAPAAQPEQTDREAVMEKAMRGVLRSIIQFVIDKDGNWVAIRQPAIENLRLVLAARQADRGGK